MDDAHELAQRYLALWADYLTALVADPRMIETLKRWQAFAGQFTYPERGAPQSGKMPVTAPVSVWPPLLGPFGLPAVVPSDAEPAKLVELASRIDELEQRLAALERRPKPRRRRRAPAARAS